MSLSGDRSNSTLGGNSSSGHATPGDHGSQWTAPAILSLSLFALTFLLGVPGNGAVVWVTGFKMKRTVHTVCYLNLAVADLTYCLTLPFLLASLVVQGPRHKHQWLQMFLLCAVALNASASVFLLTLISISRCLAVTRPIWFRQHLGLARARAACFGAWGLAFVLCLPVLLSQQTWVTLKVTWVIFTFGLPVAVMAACYLLIGRELRGDRFAKSRKPVCLAVTVVVAFIVCWLPSTVFRLHEVFSQHIPAEWIYVTLGLASFNSALNPLLYVFTGLGFRQVFRRSLAASLRMAFAEGPRDPPPAESGPSDAS